MPNISARDDVESDDPSAPDASALRIRELNDEFRVNGSAGGRSGLGQLMITRGLSDLGNDAVARAIQTVRAFAAFTPENDPYGEHDFGSFEQDGEPLFWKIDYYDRNLETGSPDPADPALTRRVLTIMLAHEY